jgi:hypothetical protein
MTAQRMRATHELRNALQGQAWIEAAVKVGGITRDHEGALSSRDQNDGSVDCVGGSRAPAGNTCGFGEDLIERWHDARRSFHERA